MKKVFFSILVILAIIAAIMLIPNDEQKNVLYGERAAVFKSAKNTSRLFFDKIGDLYPSGEISNAALLKSGASIKAFCKNNVERFCYFADQYKLGTAGFSEDGFNQLQNAIITAETQKINDRLPEFSNVYILIHGFRKPLASHNSTTSSYVDNIIIKSAIEGEATTDNYFIEVYWDAMYDFFEPTKTNQQEETFRIFENEARTNAVFTGYGLRKIIAALKTSRITVIAHSLGARVALSCLLNTYDEYVPEHLQLSATPEQKRIDICLIAPAISGKPFEEYYDRTHNLQDTDNYHLHLLYNEEDFVLLKKFDLFGPGPEKYGDTSLGCNYKDAVFKLKTTFDEKYPGSGISIYKADIGKTHLVEHYVHSKTFSAFLTSLEASF